VRIWAKWIAADPEAAPPVAQDYDYLTLKFATALPNLSVVSEQIADRRGIVHLVTPPSPDNRRLVVGLAIAFPTRKCDQLNNDDATTRRYLAQWLEYYAIEQDAEFVIYAKTTLYPRALPGEDPISPAGVAVGRCYRGRLVTFPPELFGLLNSMGGSLPAYLALEFNVSDQGEFVDWDLVDTTSGEWIGR
jgi:hypothetical protein